jgi:hypothetical protein
MVHGSQFSVLGSLLTGSRCSLYASEASQPVVPSGWAGGHARDLPDSADVKLFGRAARTESYRKSNPNRAWGSPRSAHLRFPRRTREILKHEYSVDAHFGSQPRERPRVSPENRTTIRESGRSLACPPAHPLGTTGSYGAVERERTRTRERERLLILSVVFAPAASASPSSLGTADYELLLNFEVT